MIVLLVRAYLEVAILLTVAWAVAAGGFTLAERLSGRQPARSWLRVFQILLIAACSLPVVARVLLPSQALFRAPVQVYSASTGPRIDLAFGEPDRTRFPHRAGHSASLGQNLPEILALVFVASSSWGLGRLFLDARRLYSLCRESITIRRAGRLRVCVSAGAAVPFSTWCGLRAHVVIPERFVLSPVALRVALVHEFAHIRSGDAAWAWVTATLRALLPWHPASWMWDRWLSRVEELACDERVLMRRSISPRAYGECLAWAADTAGGKSTPPPDFAVAMLDDSKTFLERRLTMVFAPPASKHRLWIAAASAAALTLLGITAVLAEGAIADRRLAAGDVQAIADDLARTTGFRVTADETVIAEMNAIVSRPEARAHFKEGLTRLDAYRPVGEQALRTRGLPVELLAIPQQESRVQPLPDFMNVMHSAGIWQFIPATARHYGLKVDDTIDERLDPVRSAEAAAAMLDDLHEEFHDWRLAIAAYNAGRDKVRKAMAAQKTSDAVALVKAGALSRYASSVLATALLIHKPDLLE